MIKRAIVSVFLGFFLSSCASMYGTPEQRQQKNALLPDYTLCEKLAIATLAPEQVRAEWAMELQKRGVDCGAYSGLLNHARQQNENMRNLGIQMMQQSRPQPLPYTPSTRAVNCFKTREWTSGLNKNCVYDCVGSEAVQTIGATELCPLMISR